MVARLTRIRPASSRSGGSRSPGFNFPSRKYAASRTITSSCSARLFTFPSASGMSPRLQAESFFDLPSRTQIGLEFRPLDNRPSVREFVKFILIRFQDETNYPGPSRDATDP